MGVPGAFAYFLKNYKKHILTTERVKVDYFFIDTNCLLHPQCFKVLDNNKNWKNLNQLEKLMLDAIISYLEYIINYADPQKCVYIAIDGVAPMTKIKHQRLRRFRSVVDYENNTELKKKYGVEITNFWTNASITPGTTFMKKITDKIIEYIETTLKPSNPKRKIIFSSAQTPGEGEHKIMQYIRKKKFTEKDHLCIYGLDADLLFLSLANKNKNIFLLREYKEINKSLSDFPFVYVNIDNLRECVVKTFKNVNVEHENVVQDFIILCYLLGNDFIPHIPSLSIYDKGIDIVIDMYSQVYTDKPLVTIEDKKINLNLDFLMGIFHLLAENEIKYFRKQHYKRQETNYPTPNSYDEAIKYYDNLQFKYDDPIKMGSDHPKEWKKRYYEYYLTEYNSAQVLKSCQLYVEGIIWIAYYYFVDCISWTWYYPYDSSPFVSDLHYFLANSKLRNISFKKGKAFQPIMQLLMVIPPKLDFLLPKYYRKLQTNQLKIYFPETYEIDYINKKKGWEGTPILPQLNLNIISNVINNTNKIVCEKKLSDECNYLNTINQRIDDYKF
jgi:5'-3' exonuclease